MEEEENLKRETDRRVQEEEKEEQELLKRLQEVRERKGSLARLGEERLERVRREEKELMNNLQAQNHIIRQELQRDRLSPLLTPTATDREVEALLGAVGGVDATVVVSSSSFRPISREGAVASDKKGGETRAQGPRQPPAMRRPPPIRLSPTFDLSVQEVGEVKPDITSLMTEITTAFQRQSDMMHQLTASHLKLQKEMKEVLKANSQPSTEFSSTTTTSTTSKTSTLDTLLAHARLPDTRPLPEDRWKGGRDVKSFLKTFKTLVEDIPGITQDMVWNEMHFRTTGLALRLLDPFKDEEAAVAIQKTKERYLRIWARTPRDVREILEEAVRGGQAKINDFNALISLIAELENYRRQAALNGDENKFDEADTIMAIVAARLTNLEIKWSKYALKKRNHNEIVNFQALITFIEDEAAALEEPEGVKARARAHEFVGQIQRQVTSKRAPEKDKWGGRGGKFEPLIVNAVQFPSNPLPSHQVSPRWGSQSRAVAAPPAASASTVSSQSSSLSTQASPFVPTSTTQYYDRGRERRFCAACKGPHSFYACGQFLAMDSAARRPFTANHRVCFKCANSVTHSWRQCTQQNLKCFWCHSTNHHSTLHVDDDASPEPFTDARLAGGPFMMGAAAAGSSTTKPLVSMSFTTPPPSSSS